MKLAANLYRPLGKTGLRVPPIVFGTSALGNFRRVISDVAKLEIVSDWFEYVAPPVLIDTAGKYGAGLAMEVLGKSLAKLEIPPGDVLIGSQLGWKRVRRTTPEPTCEPDTVQRISYDGMLECWDESCRLLGDDYRPRLVSVHDPDEYLAAAASAGDRLRRFDDVVGAYRALAELKQQGHVLGVGVGAKDWRMIEEIASAVAFDWVTLAGSLTVLRHPPELLAFIARLVEQDIAVITSGVFHSGFLVGGKFFDGRVVRPGNDADRPLFAWRKSFVALCEAHGISPMHACVQFVLSVPGVVAVALNTSHADRIKEQVTAVAAPVPPQFWASLKEEGLLANEYPYG